MLLALGSLLGTSGGCSIGRTAPCECPTPDVQGPSVCTAQDVAEAEDADHRGRWARVDPEAGPALAALETSASPREIGLDALHARIAAARIVFVPDVHDHILSGRLTSKARGSLVLVPYDRELWRIACDRLDLCARPASEPLAIELSAGVLLFHTGIAPDASPPRARPEERWNV